MSPLRYRSPIHLYGSTANLAISNPILNCEHEQSSDCSTPRPTRNKKNPFGRRGVLRWRTKPPSLPQQCTTGEEDVISTTSSSSTTKIANPTTLGHRVRRWRVPIMCRNPAPKICPAYPTSQNSTESTLVTTCSQKSVHTSPISDCTESNDNSDHTLVSRIISKTSARLAGVSDSDAFPSRYRSNLCNDGGEFVVTRSKSEKIRHNVSLQCDGEDDEQRLRATRPYQQARNGAGDRNRVFKKSTSSGQERRLLYKALSANSTAANNGSRARDSRRLGSSLRRLSLRRIMDNCERDDEIMGGWRDGMSSMRMGTIPSNRDSRSGGEKASIDGTSFQSLLKQFQGAKVEGMKYGCDVGQESPWGLKNEELKESREHSVVGKMVKAVWRGWKDSSSDRSSDCDSDDSEMGLDLDTEGIGVTASEDRKEGRSQQNRPANLLCREVELTQDDFIDFCSPSSNSRSRSMFSRRVKLVSPR